MGDEFGRVQRFQDARQNYETKCTKVYKIEDRERGKNIGAIQEVYNDLFKRDGFFRKKPICRFTGGAFSSECTLEVYEQRLERLKEEKGKLDKKLDEKDTHLEVDPSLLTQRILEERLRAVRDCQVLNIYN